MPNHSDDTDSQIIMQGIHVDLTAAMQNVIREKFSVLFRHQERIIRINVRLQLDQKRGQKNFYAATAQLEIGGPDLIATAKGEEAYTLLDEIVSKLDEQLRERQGRRKDKRNHPKDVEIAAELPKLGPE